jgi:transcriptional regulator with XRE-family HTH domain
MDASQAIAIRNRIIGILVKRARLAASKSQRECADFLGCSPYMFGQYEAGQRGMSLPQLEALAHFLHLPLSSLWDETDVLDSEEPAEPLPIAQLMLLRRKVLAIQLRQCRDAVGLTQQELAKLLGRSAYIVSQYEQAKRDVPLAELEIIAEQGNRGLADFMDEQALPLDQDDQDRQALTQLGELDPQVREFVLKPTNALYMRIAMLLSSLKADSLRQIAETILDITY